MHEIGVVRQVLKTVENFAKENGLDRIDTIVLEIGDLSLVIPKYVEDIYKVIIKDTPFEFTKLKIEVVEGQGVCREGPSPLSKMRAIVPAAASAMRT